MKINTDIEKIVPPDSYCAEYYKEQGKELAQKENQEKVKLLKEKCVWDNNEIVVDKWVHQVIDKIFKENKNE